MILHSRMVALCAAVSCFLALQLAATATATTIKPIKVAATDQGDGSYAGTATCPAGRRVVSGGFADADAPSVAVNRASGKHAWTVRAFDTNQISVVAYCSKYLKVTKETATGEMDEVNDQQGGATASCPSGSRVTSGGWEYTNPIANSPVYTSRPVGARDWTLYAASNDAGNSITAYAYCVTGKKTRVRAGSKQSTSVARSRSGRTSAGQSRGFATSPSPTATSICKPGETLFGGGFETTPTPDFFNTNGPDTFFGKSARFKKRGWKAYATDYSSMNGKLQAFAVCHVPGK